MIDATPHRWLVLCYDKHSGAKLWERTAHTGVPRVKRHTKSTHASSTLATDGRYIVAFFGSEGLYAYDMKGTEVWKKDFGVLDSGFFMAPGGAVGVRQLADHPRRPRRSSRWTCRRAPSSPRSTSRPAGNCGARRARMSRPGARPPCTRAGDRAQVVVNGWKHIGGYDLETGQANCGA